MEINNFQIDNNNPPFIIAEISGNHKGDLARTKYLMLEAKNSGFSAVKIQYFTADDMTLPIESNEFVVQSGLWQGRSLYSLYNEGALPKQWLPELFSYANEIEVTLFTSVFSIDSLEYLEELGCPAYKVASFEAMDLPLIKAIAKTGKPIIVSTGIIDKEGINDVIKTCESVGNNNLAILHCVSNYPATFESFNLKTISDMIATYRFPIGLSDHSLNEVACISAISLGACIIEKHITVSQDDGAIDSEFSLPVSEFNNFIDKLNSAHKSIGGVDYSNSSPRKNYRSLYVIEDIKEGETFSELNVKSIRPGHGLAPKYFYDIINKKASTNIKRGQALTWEMIIK